MIDYILDIWIISDQRIIDVRQKGLFSHDTSEVKFSRIQDISTDMSGVLQTFFKYGTVTVQTASDQDKLFFEQVPNPEQIRDMLMKMTPSNKDA